jgi:hypothetical protein
MAILRFRSPADSKTNLDAKVTVSGDNTAATALLASTDTSKIKQSNYELFSVDKTGAEQDMNRSLTFRLPPSIAAGQAIPAAGNFTLTGSNLAGVSFVAFYDAASDTTEKARVSVIAASSTDSSITAPVPLAASLPTGPSYKIRLVLADGANTLYQTGTTVTH